MIVFDGYITGKAEKRFIQKQRNLLLTVFIPSLAICFPLFYVLFKDINRNKEDAHLITIYVIMCALIILFMVIMTKNKKENLKVMPYKIQINEKRITAFTKNKAEEKNIDSVKEVIDCGDFYDLKFCYGEKSLAFICQKNLLTQGTLQEFEKIFKDKLIKK